MNLLTDEEKEKLKNNCAFRVSLKDQSTKELVAYLVNHDLVTQYSPSDAPDERLYVGPLIRYLGQGFTLTFISRNTDTVFYGRHHNMSGLPVEHSPHPYLGDICIDGTDVQIPVGRPETQLAYHIHNKFNCLGRNHESKINGELRWGIKDKDKYLIPLDTISKIDNERRPKMVLIAHTPTKEKFQRYLELKKFTIRQLCETFAEEDKHRKGSHLCLTGDEYYIAFKQLVSDGWIFITESDADRRGLRIGVEEDWSLQHLFLLPHFPVNTINKEADLRGEIANTTYFKQKWNETLEEGEHYKKRNSELESVIALLQKDISLLRQELAAHKTGMGSIDTLFKSKDIAFHRDMRRDFMRVLHPDKTDNPRAHEYSVFLNQLWDKLK